MIICPYCENENIEGEDFCEQCEQPLNELHLPTPATVVERSLLRDHINVLGPKKPLAVDPGTPISRVLRLLVDHSVGCVVVVEGEKVVGIFSERDALLKLNTEAAELGDRPVSDFMTHAPQTLEATAKIAFAVQRMDLGGFRHVPIVSEEGRLTGVISVRDILRYLTEKITTAQAV